MSTIEVGDLLYEYTVKFTEVTEYGVNLEALLAGEVRAAGRGGAFRCRVRGRINWTETQG